MTGTLTSIAATADTAPQPTERAQLQKVAQAFEAVFARQMIGAMRTASLGEDLLGSDAGSQFRDMSDARLAESMASGGALGIAEMLLKQFGGLAASTDTAAAS